nr:competence type IV pilus major pilin ComGC [uncultured Bacillus sp.]
MKDSKYARLAIEKINEQNAFTLIEMMIVLLVISVLLLITIPNVTKNNSTINNKGCQAYVRMIEGQVQAYEMDHGKLPTLEELKDDGYLKEGETKCPNGDDIVIGTDGSVTTSP